jgi:hypothetical protein
MLNLCIGSFHKEGGHNIIGVLVVGNWLFYFSQFMLDKTRVVDILIMNPKKVGCNFL